MRPSNSVLMCFPIALLIFMGCSAKQTTVKKESGPGTPTATDSSQPGTTAPMPPITAKAVKHDVSHTITLVAFGTDQRTYGMKVVDSVAGPTFVAMDGITNQFKGQTVFEEGDDKSAWRRFRWKHKLTIKPDFSQKKPGEDYVLVAADTPEYVIVYVMKGNKVAPYFRIPRLKNNKGEPAKVTIKRLAWEPTGKFAVFIHNQSWKKPMPFTSDYAHTFQVLAFRLPF
jgi:hypothetical protein